MKLEPSHRLYALGTILLVSLCLCARRFSGQGEAFPLAPLLAGGVAYIVAVRELFRTRDLPKHVIIVGLLLAAMWHVAFLRLPTGSDDDVRRYVWDGRLQHLGYNPYVVVPSDPAYASFHTAETRALNNANLPSPYPPGAQLFFRTVTAIRETTFAMRLAFVVAEVVLVFVLYDVLRQTGRGTHWVLAFAWNPLLATEVAGTGHIDIVGALLLVVSFAALLRRWRTVAALAFALAVAVKFLPVVLLPLYWRRIRIRDAALGIAAFAALYIPFLEHGKITTGSLGIYVQSFRFNGPAFEAMTRVVSPQLAAAAAVLAGAVVAAWFRMSSEALTAHSLAWPMVASLLLAPVVYPWYLLWILPFVGFISTMPLIVWTVSILPTYLVWHLRAMGKPWKLPNWVLVLEYGAVAATAFAAAWRSNSRSRNNAQPTSEVPVP